jgi:hypothetical protein
MTPYLAYSIAVGVQAPLSIEQAAEAVAVLEAHPEMLTNGEACRGLDRLRYIVERHSFDE